MAPSVAVNGEKVAELRKLSGWTQKDLAEMLSMSTVNIWKIEKGCKTSPASLLKLARILRVETSELTGTPGILGAEEPTPEPSEDPERRVA